MSELLWLVLGFMLLMAAVTLGPKAIRRAERALDADLATPCACDGNSDGGRSATSPAPSSSKPKDPL